MDNLIATHRKAENKRKSSTTPNPDIIRRQSNSKENHINRIRSVNLRRLSERLPSIENVNSRQHVYMNQSPYENDKIWNADLSKYDISNKRESHENCVPEKFVEDHKNKSKQSLTHSDHFVDKSKAFTSANAENTKQKNSQSQKEHTDNISSGDSNRNHTISHKADILRKQKSIPEENKISAKINASRKTSTVETHNGTNSRKRLSRNPSKNNTETKIRQTIKTSPKSKKSALIKNEQLEERLPSKENVNSRENVNMNQSPYKSDKIWNEDLSKSDISNKRIDEEIIKQSNSSAQDNTLNFDKETEVISDLEKVFNSECTNTLKDIIVLNWTHKNNYHLTEKKRRASTASESKRPVQIPKKPPKNNLKEKLPHSIKSTGLKERSKLPNLEKEKSSVTKPAEKSGNKHLETQKSEGESIKEITKKVSDVDLHISEHGNLQIIFDAKLISPEDSAIVIWLKDISETFFIPDFNKHLQVVPKPDIEKAEHSIEVIESHSASELEDIPPTKPDIYFPPVTILKNVAVDSKIGMRRLSMDTENSVYYKRCNLGHAEWEINGELSFEQPKKDVIMK